MTNLATLRAGLAALLLLLCLPLAALAQDTLDDNEVVPPEPTEQPEWLEGRGENELILIHGLGASNEIWEKIKGYLGGTFQLHFYELHGHGTKPPLDNPTISSETAALRAWIEEQGLIYPTIAGHGLGGMIAMQYAVDYPADIQRVIIMDAAPRQLAGQEEKDQVKQSLVEDYDRFVASRYLMISNNDSINEMAVDWALRTDSASFTSLLLSSFTWDLTAELPNQSVPMLVIGSLAFFPESGYERHYLEEYGFGTARFLNYKRLESAGHYMMLENPSYLASVFIVWIRGEEMK